MKKNIIFIVIIVILLLFSIISSITSGDYVFEHAIPFNQTISMEDLEEGVKCHILMSSSIGRGPNTDDYRDLYGNIESFKEDENTFNLILENGNLIKHYEPGYAKKHFEIKSETEKGINLYAFNEGEGNLSRGHFSINGEGLFRMGETYDQFSNERIHVGLCKSKSSNLRLRNRSNTFIYFIKLFFDIGF